MSDRYDSSFMLLREVAKDKPVVNLSSVLPIDGKTPLNSRQLMREPSRTGEQFGRLTILQEFNKSGGGKSKSNRRHITCLCECGNVKDILLKSLKEGKTKTCGCKINQRPEYELIADGKFKLTGKSLELLPAQIGKTFGRLKIEEEFLRESAFSNGTTVKSRYFIASCKCGSGEKEYRASDVISGSTKSCGCYARDETVRRSKANIKHGHCRGNNKSKEHSTWTGIKQRCRNPKNCNYSNYGARGIDYCDRWEDFNNFLEDVGLAPFPDAQIDRINNNKGYEPGNVRWVTNTVNSRNTRRSVLDSDLAGAMKGYRNLFLYKEIASFGELSRLIGCDDSTLCSASLGKTWKEIEPMTDKSQILRTITRNFKKENLPPLPDFSKARAIIRKHHVTLQSQMK